MDYTGKTVYHENLGKGIIISQDAKGYLSVRFENDSSLRPFRAPFCFKKFLKLADEEAAAYAAEENKNKEEAEKAAEEQKKREEQARIFAKKMKEKQSGHNDKNIRVPAFSSLEDFYAEQEKVLLAEIAYLKNNGGKRIKLFDGKLVEAKNGRFIYSFESDSELNLPDNTQISLWPSSSQDSIQAIVVNCEDFTVIIASSQNLGREVSMIEFSAEPWRLLRYLIDRLNKLKDHSSPIVKELVLDGKKMIQFGEEIRKGQDTACQMSISQPITFIWDRPEPEKQRHSPKLRLCIYSREIEFLCFLTAMFLLMEPYGGFLIKTRVKSPVNLSGMDIREIKNYYSMST